MISDNSARSQDNTEITYRIDAHDVLVEVAGDWNEFTAANGAPEMRTDKVLNRPLWDFIHDDDTRQLHKSLLKRARGRHEMKGVPFRCDGPAIRRYMTMDITLLEERSVLYRCRIVRTESRPSIDFFHNLHGRGDVLLSMCSWCNKVEMPNQTWQEIEEAVTQMGLLELPYPPRMTHAICDVCMVQLLGEEAPAVP